MRVTIIATDPKTHEVRIIEADGIDEATATEAARAQVPVGWQALSIRKV
ncbi:hypothetical protein [Agromyces silvae]|nr:hypothetical protein [Agromyces protaetiae]